MPAAVAPEPTLREPGTMTLVEIYKELALQERGRWEFAPCLGLRRKPVMSSEHFWSNSLLSKQLTEQLLGQSYHVSMNGPALQLVDGVHHYLADVCVVPFGLSPPPAARPRGLWTVAEPLPLVVEVWSPSTGDYDMETKFAEYKARGDHEIWRIHPYERTVTTWGLQPDGSYSETVYTGGEIPVLWLPGVTIVFDILFQ